MKQNSIILAKSPIPIPAPIQIIPRNLRYSIFFFKGTVKKFPIASVSLSYTPKTVSYTHLNGNVEKEGTAYERNNWEITGEWKYYDEQGKLKRIEILIKMIYLKQKNSIKLIKEGNMCIRDRHIPQLINLIEMLDSQIKSIEKEIDSSIDEESPILTIPGINTVAAASILGEINDIDNFDSSSKLLAFSGLDPKRRQSGNFSASSCRMSKKGSPYLRYALIFTAWNLVRNSETFFK